jgi:RNA polymerase sigma factor (TIGR02999 family)
VYSAERDCDSCVLAKRAHLAIQCADHLAPCMGSALENAIRPRSGSSELVASPGASYLTAWNRGFNLCDMLSETDITGLLGALRAGDRSALGRLVPLVHGELHAAAHRQLLRARPGDTLGTTALVNETYLKLADAGAVSLRDRAHFFAVAAMAMRQIIVDYARRSQAQKRGGGADVVTLNQDLLAAPRKPEEFIALDEALTRLAAVAERPARVVELRYFGGMSVEDTAAVLEISPRTVKREWQKARAWLYDALSRGYSADSR